LSQLRCRELGLGRARLPDEPLEAGEIELVRAELDQVAARAGDDRARAARVERLAELREPDPESRRARFRRLVPPERLQQTVTGDDLVRVEEQHGEQGPLLRAPHRHLPALVPDLQRAEEAEVHYSGVT